MTRCPTVVPGWPSFPVGNATWACARPSCYPACPSTRNWRGRIGLERLREGVARLDHGNADIGEVVDRFWLDGPLQISAIEQARFLARLAQERLPYSAATQAATREIVRMEQGDGWVLYGKTGWQNAPAPGVGWWVGWVDKASKVHALPSISTFARRVLPGSGLNSVRLSSR